MDVSVRDLRNHTSRVLRDVESGESVRVTVDRRPVAELVPLRKRDFWVASSAWSSIRESQADSGLKDELRELLPQTIDEL